MRPGNKANLPWWTLAVGPIVFLTFVLAAGAVGGGLTTSLLTTQSSRTSRTRTGSEEPSWDIKVTHVVFDHTFKPDADGPATGDALSIRIDWDNELQHGPRRVPEGDEYGGGEWIVKDNQETLAKRNEPALYLQNDKYSADKPIKIYARFEATANVAKATLLFDPPPGWYGVAPLTVNFTNKVKINKFPTLLNRSVGGMPPSMPPLRNPNDEYVLFTTTGSIPKSIEKLKIPFQWKVRDVLLVGETDSRPGRNINMSGVPTDEQVASITLTPDESKGKTPAEIEELKRQKALGHPFYVILDKPKAPWYMTQDQSDSITRGTPLPPPGGAGDHVMERTWAWTKALDKVTLPAAALHATVLEGSDGATGKLTTFIHTTEAFTLDHTDGYLYDIGSRAALGGRLHHTLEITIPDPRGARAPRILVGNRVYLGEMIDHRGSLVNCVDVATTLAAYANLCGAGSENRFQAPWGYIDTDLIGVGRCNNPFYGESARYVGTAVCDQLSPRRSYFGTHTYVLLNSKAYDATAGPHLGTETEDAYQAASLDSAPPSPAHLPVMPMKLLLDKR